MARFGAIDGDRIFRDLLDRVPADQHVHAGVQRGALAVEDANVLEENDGWLSGLSERGAEDAKSGNQDSERTNDHRILRDLLVQDPPGRCPCQK
jgi:hypothetical protein